MSRECGGCTACCKTHPVASVQKPAVTWCRHCTKGVGCAIYGQHPEDCAAFECQWLKGYGTEAERPDKVRIVIDYCPVPSIGKLVGQIYEVSHGAFNKPFFNRALRDLFSLGVPVVVTYANKRQELYLPPGLVLNETIRKTCAETGIVVKRYTPAPTSAVA